MEQDVINLDYNVDNLFPTPLHYLYIDDFESRKQKLMEYAYDLREKSGYSQKASNKGGWQSTTFKVEGGDILQDLLLTVINNIPSFHSEVTTETYAWININKPGDYNHKHNHPNCHLAGVLWIKCPEDCGVIVFDPPTAFQSHNELNSYIDDFKNQNNLYHCYHFNPTEGKILVFPAHLNHLVQENKSNEDRISVSFNIRLNSGRMKRRGRVSIPRWNFNWSEYNESRI